MKKTSTLFILCSCYCISIFGHTSIVNLNGDDKTTRIETSFFISPEEEVVITGSLNVPYANTLINSGKLYLINTEESDIIMPSGNLGTGEFVFNGNENYNLVLQENASKIENLIIDMPDRIVNLSGKLTILNKLELKTGILNVDESSILLVENTNPSSVIFNCSPINKGYISGVLSRQVEEDMSYHFPVGNIEGFHPFLIDKPMYPDILSVAYDEDIALRCQNSCNDNSIVIEDHYGWRVESDSQDRNTFLAGLSLMNTDIENKAQQLDIYYLSDIDYANSVFSTQKNIISSALHTPYLIANNRNSIGFYAFSNLLDNELVNFLYVKNGNKSNFEIPNSEDFSNIYFCVYNRLGSMIFKSDHYVNEFDARNYPDGTYFFELSLERAGIKKIIRNFIDIKHEN